MEWSQFFTRLLYFNDNGIVRRHTTKKKKNQQKSQVILEDDIVSTQLNRRELNWIKPGQGKNKHNEQPTTYKLKHYVSPLFSLSQSRSLIYANCRLYHGFC